ncbi:MAG: glycoside hydrolase family 1 protein [Candidatus Omnitrophica bacterium]|nr:glycoside hydrolase family 1 protein [Candidatus Omnitrophota bacterium]
MIQFPKGFLWGAATSAYQVEGNNIASDWWEWEKRLGQKEPSGLACRHYELYAQDFDLARSLGHNAHRLSLEWSRIEPEEGRFQEAQLKHYLDVILALRERGIEPVVTLHHFTNPLWFSLKDGWHNEQAVSSYLRYTGRALELLSPHVRFWVTINEPMVYVYHAYVLGIWPPQERSLAKGGKVTNNLLSAHVEAYKLIHAIYKKKGLPMPMVSIAQNLQAFVACKANLRNRIALYLRNKCFNFDFIDNAMRKKSLDFLGINYYSRSLVDTRGWGVKNLLLDTCRDNHSDLPKNSLGWDIYPQGLYDLLLSLKRYDLPVFILENGICTDKDSLRWNFIRRHIEMVHQARQKGVNLIGYLYWSLLDNFEWDKGFSPRFGLIDVDYATYRRTPRDSANKFAEVCRTGTLND